MSSLSITSENVNVETAALLMDAAIKASESMGLEIAVAIVDAGGHLRSFQRTDGAPFLTVEAAISKAWTAASYHYPTHIWNDYIHSMKVAPLMNIPRLMPVGGGYPLSHNNKQFGAIGVSGGDYEQDRQICVAALKALGLSLYPGDIE